MTRKSKARYGMSRTYKLNAAVKALRSALFASLAMAAVAPAAQAACSVVDNTITCTGAFGSTLVFGPGDVALPFDLTTIQLDAGTDIDVNGNYGVSAFSLMDMALTNDGSIDVYSEIGDVVGIFARSQYGDVAVINNGSISATSNSGDAAGILAVSAYGDVSVSTGADSSITAESVFGDASGILAQSFAGDVSVDNAGAITASSAYGDAFGINASSRYGEVSVANSGEIVVESAYGQGYGIYALSFYDAVSVENSGDITVQAYYQATGIYAISAYDEITVDNSGTITVASSDGLALGIKALGLEGDVSINNDGDITVEAVASNAIGIAIYAGVSGAPGTDISVTGSGDISAATPYGNAIGINANNGDDYGTITIDVSGDISVAAYAFGNAIGINANSYAGDINITSSGSIDASNTYGSAIGIKTGRFGYSVINNSGDISAETYVGNAIGIQADSFYGTYINNSGDISAETTYGSARGIQALTTFDVTVVNSGDLTVSSYATGSAQGIRAKSTNGLASVTNSGDITATSHFTNAISILATGLYGVEVVNSGDLSADTDYAIAYGIYAQTRFYDASVSNTGDISAHSSYATANGIYSKGGDSSIINNSGDITATSDYANAYGAYAYGQFGAAAIFNSGDISVSAYNDATGLFAKTLYGVAYINNSGDVSVDSQYGIAAYGLYASAFGNTAVVLNYGGAISASSYDTDASAIVAVALDDVVIYNSGDLSAYSYNGDAIGIVGATTDGNVTIYNIGGDIRAESINANAYGIYARSVNGDVEVISTGDLNISGSDLALGIYAVTGVGNVSVYNSGGMIVSNSYVGAGIAAVAQAGDVEVLNAGSMSVEAYAYAVGITAGAGNGAAYVANSGDFNIRAVGPAIGIHAQAEFDADVFNLGDISVYSDQSYAGGIFSESDAGDAYVASQGNITATGATNAGGILALAQYGSATAFNSGDISVYGPEGSFGIRAEAEYDVFVANSGSITATAVNGASTGIDAVSYDGDVTVYNSGDFVVSGINATGIYTYSTYGDISISNTGDLRATGVDEATGISAGTDEYDSDITISNSLNTIVASAGMNGAAYGIYAYSDGSGDIGITSAGIITATGGKAFGIYAATDNDNSYYSESGVSFAGGNIGITLGAASNITATATNMGSYGEYAAYNGGDAAGVYARVEEDYGDISISNAGRISATANGLYATASGIHAYDEYDGTVSITTASTSVISATANGDHGSAFGIYANAYGNVVISNAGSITAGATDASGTSAGILAYSAYGTSISNTGTIGATGSDPWAIVSYSGGNTVITNGTSGILNGAVYTTDGNDSLTNSGRWNVGNANASYFGGGSDTITNNSGARIFMDGSTIDMGYSEGSSNSFLNNGRLYANGDNVIDMGGSTSVFTNNGSSIHMDDADVNDTLTIIGDFAGNGHIVVNASGASLLADQLYIEGDVAANTANIVDVKLLSGPSIADMLDGETIEIVHVSGTSSAANFNIGVVTPPFDELYTIESSLIKEINYSGSNDRFSLGFDISGLSTAGVVASSVAPGVQSLWNQGTGTLFQREGTHREFNQNPDGSGKAEYKAAAGVWVRGFTSSGSLSPEVSHDNFGAGGSGNFDMDGSGIEFGVGYAFNSQWAAGLLGGTSESTVDPESGGRADIDADTLGAYVTYTPGNGFYADFSYRAMDFDGYGLGGQSEFGFEGSADGYSLEMGYGYKMSSGLIIEPQFQYSSVDVDLDTIGYNASEFELTDGDSSQFRIGAALRKSYKTAGGNYWTPYGALSWLNEADGSNSYEIGGLLTGDVDTGGGSALLEAGVTGFIGGFGLSAGVNWRDGSAYDSVLGGQLSVRYDW